MLWWRFIHHCKYSVLCFQLVVIFFKTVVEKFKGRFQPERELLGCVQLYFKRGRGWDVTFFY